MSDKGELKVHRMVLAINCGHAVNPQQIAMQVEGSIAFGLTATLYGEPTICVAAPAVPNAIHAATGKPVRILPLKNVRVI